MSRRYLLLCLTASLLVTISALSQTACSKVQTAQQIEAHIDALIAQMSVPERIAQLGDRAPALPLLGLPAYNWWNEGLHGSARNGYATVFPQAIGLAATWDPPLLRAVGDIISTEARAKFNPHSHADSLRYGGLTIWSPNINIFRDPRWGRGQETYGEDPYLTSTLGTQFVKGIQGDNPFYLKADATPKHFVAHSGPERGRDSFHANASRHDLADTYLPAFHALLTQGNAAALMCSYNAIDNTPSCANSLLRRVVRDTWHFSGYIVSDCDAVGNLTEYQHYAPDVVHAAAAALNAGTDLDCGNSYEALNDALAQHLTSEATIDRAVHRLLLARARLGLLDPSGCSPYDRITSEQNDTPEHRNVALRAAEESVVLLKNSGVLPLDPAKSIAVIGVNADSLNILEANYHGTASHPITPLEGLIHSFSNVSYAQGSLLAEGVAAPIPRTALRTAATADAQKGLLAEYFNNTTFSGHPAITTIVPSVNLDLDRVAPDHRISTLNYSARWSGLFVPPAAGDYILHVNIERCWDCTTHDHFRLIVDDNLVIYNDGSKVEPNQVTLHATDITPHKLILELAHTGEDEGINLSWEPPTAALLDEAVRATQNSSIIIAFVGLSPDLEGEALNVHLDGFDGGDRLTLALPSAQQTLLKRLETVNKPIVLVLDSGSAVALDATPFDALLEAWYPGEAGGQALANVLTGHTSPSGRLPVTFYRSVADLPAFDDYNMAHRTYRYFDGPILYPFGFGLSYTRFAYGPVHLSTRTLAAGQPITATVMLHNSGRVLSGEVAEVYVVPPQATGSPRLALSGFRRVQLNPDEHIKLTFTLTPAQLSFVDAAGNRTVSAGTYRVFIGGGQPTADQLADPTAGSIFHIIGGKSIAY
jgi:beta-glucosidase